MSKIIKAIYYLFFSPIHTEFELEIIKYNKRVNCTIDLPKIHFDG